MKTPCLPNTNDPEELSDGSEVRAPLSWHPRLHDGTDAERANWRLIGNGVSVLWPDLDEDIGVEGLVLGERSREGGVSLAGWLNSREQS
jgi:hypothetical protein